MRKELPLEHCCVCDTPTGKAGAGDGSFYCPACWDGPFCELCYDEHMAQYEEEEQCQGR